MPMEKLEYLFIKYLLSFVFPIRRLRIPCFWPRKGREKVLDNDRFVIRDLTGVGRSPTNVWMDDEVPMTIGLDNQCTSLTTGMNVKGYSLQKSQWGDMRGNVMMFIAIVTITVG